MRLSHAEARTWGIDVPTRSKYGAVRTDGFDSKREASRWNYLLAIRGYGEISDLRRQPEFHCWIHGRLVCKYRADFMYQRDGATVIEDSKGFRTRDYILKRKLVAALFGVEIQET